MDHDIFEHLGTSHIVRQGEGSVYFFFLGGGRFQEERKGDESSPTEYQGGTIENQLLVRGGVNFIVTQPNSPLPPTPQHQKMNNDRSSRGNYSVNASVTPQQREMTSCNGERLTHAHLIFQEHGMDNELMNLALLSSPQDMLDVARLDIQFYQRYISEP